MLLNMKEILETAKEHNFAIPAFNIGTGQILNGVMDTCEELNAPVILAIHPNELEFQGESFIKTPGLFAGANPFGRKPLPCVRCCTPPLPCPGKRAY